MIIQSHSSRKGSYICGPSQQQEALAGQETAFSNLLQSNYNTNFGAQSAELQKLNNTFTPIAQAGPDQQGFGPQELAALNTQAGEGIAANYAKAQQSLNTNLSAQGGGNEFLPTGAQSQLKSSLATAGANELSNAQIGITEANYNQGRTNYNNATSGLNALAQEYNPNAIAGETTSANQGAFGEETKIQDMKNQEVASIAGGITSLAGGFLSGGLSNLDTTGSSSGGEQVGNFFSGGLQGLKG